MNDASVASPQPRRMRQSLRALLAGFLVVVLFSTGTDVALQATGVFPAGEQRMSDGLFLLALGYRTLYAIAGCYVAARLAPDRPMRHALGLGGVGMALAVAGSVAMWGAGPAWYNLGVIATAIPGAWVGGWLHERRVVGRTA